MKFLAFSLLFLITIQSFAQENPNKLPDLAKMEKYRKMKNTGIVLTAVGSVLVVVGFVTMYNSSVDLWTGEETGNVYAGAATVLIGAGGLGSGIPLWIVGANNHRKYKNKVEGITVRLNSNPQSRGLTLTYRF